MAVNHLDVGSNPTQSEKPFLNLILMFLKRGMAEWFKAKIC